MKMKTEMRIGMGIAGTCPKGSFLSKCVEYFNALVREQVSKSTEVKKKARGFVLHWGTADYNRNSPSASLNFLHKFSNMRITFLWLFLTFRDQE
jgi:hypothetical protein